MKTHQIIIVLSLFAVIGCSNQNAELQQQVLLQQQQLQEMQLQQLQKEQAAEQAANDAEMAQKARRIDAFYARYNNTLIDDELSKREAYLEGIRNNPNYFKNYSNLRSDWTIPVVGQDVAADWYGVTSDVQFYRNIVLTTPSLCRERTKVEQEKVIQFLTNREERSRAISAQMDVYRNEEVKEELARRAIIRREQDARNAVEYNRQFGAPPSTRIIMP